MTKAQTNAFADAAANAFNSVVDTLVMQKLTNLPSFSAGVSLASETATNPATNVKQNDPSRGL